jgi:excinuclease ABC subunit C
MNEKDFSDKDLKAVLTGYRQTYNSSAKMILSNIKIQGNNITTTIPRRGDKKKLLDLARINMEQLKHEMRMGDIVTNDKITVLHNLQEYLQLKKIPQHIECFDNSNLCGTNPVASCVVFKNGEPSKNEYRHFKIRTVVGPDDYKTMEEVLWRRYAKAEILPDLIIVDGGIGQLHAAIKVLQKLNIVDKVDVCGLAKQFEEIVFNDGRVIRLPYNSQELRLLQYIRDETHHFAITFHRHVRRKSFLNPKEE